MDYLQYVPLINLIASAIVAVTPNKKDDGIYNQYVKPILDILALNVGYAKNGDKNDNGKNP